MVKFSEIKNLCGSILSKLSSAHDMAIKENREYFTKIGYINNLFKISFILQVAAIFANYT